MQNPVLELTLLSLMPLLVAKLKQGPNQAIWCWQPVWSLLVQRGFFLQGPNGRALEGPAFYVLLRWNRK